MVISILVVGLGRLTGQNAVSDLYLNAGTNDFATIQKNVEKYFEGRYQGKGSGYKQWKRWEYLAARRLTPDGKVANWTVRNWEEYHAYARAHPITDAPDATNGYWTSLGPIGFTWGNGWNGGVGRINCIAFHPSDVNTFWVGAPAGGLWKTSDGGSSWTPLTDGMPVIGVSGIGVDYTNTNIIYILTGDGDAGDTRSIGVLKTTDGGETWYPTGFTYTIYNNLRGYKLLMHPTNNLTLFTVSNAGIHKTINGGTSWTLVQSGSFRDIEFKPGDPTIMYATGNSTQFFRSTNTGDTWTQVTTGVPTNATRMAIGVSPANSTYVYLFTGPASKIDTGTFVGVYRSTTSGTSFTTRSTAPNILGYSFIGDDSEHQTTYDLCMTVSRTDVNDIMTGGINTWVSTTGGSTWYITSMWDNSGVGSGVGYTHADIHNLDINPLNNCIYCCSDGGIFRSCNFGSNWTDLTYGIANTEWYRIAGYEPDANLITGGTQDNGSDKWTGGATMLHILGADGMDCMIDFINSNILYNETQYGDLEKSTNGGNSFFSVQPAGTKGNWITPMIMDPTNHLIIYSGYSDVYKSFNGGSSWTNMGGDGRDGLAIGTNNPSRLYAASGSTLYTSANGGSTWTNITAGLPGIQITFIAVNPDNSSEVYVTVGGYTDGQKVYRSLNASTWTNISGTLPNVPVNCIAYKDNNGSPNEALYIGTDIGVFYRDANHTDWIPFRNGLPTVPVFDLEINNTSSVITAGTFGRGLWRTAVYSACPSDYLLTTGNDPSNPNYTGYQFYDASNSVTSSRIITGGIGTDVTYQSNNYVVLTTGFNAREDNLFKAKLGPCGMGAPLLNKAIKVRGTFVATVK